MTTKQKLKELYKTPHLVVDIKRRRSAGMVGVCDHNWSNNGC
jgi:hypothetical protein